MAGRGGPGARLLDAPTESCRSAQRPQGRETRATPHCWRRAEAGLLQHLRCGLGSEVALGALRALGRSARWTLVKQAAVLWGKLHTACPPQCSQLAPAAGHSSLNVSAPLGRSSLAARSLASRRLALRGWRLLLCGRRRRPVHGLLGHARGLHLERVVGPKVLRVSSLHLPPHSLVRVGPESSQVRRDLRGQVAHTQVGRRVHHTTQVRTSPLEAPAHLQRLLRGRQQLQHHGHAPAGHARRL